MQEHTNALKLVLATGKISRSIEWIYTECLDQGTQSNLQFQSQTVSKRYRCTDTILPTSKALAQNKGSTQGQGLTAQDQGQGHLLVKVWMCIE
jgi:hypothetical protein